MDTLGIFALVAGIWILYAGVTGIHPLETLQKIIANPSNASAIIAEARSNSTRIQSARNGLSSGDAMDGLKGFEISRGFEQHRKDGSISPGIDFLMPVGTPVFAPAAGTLRLSTNSGGYGNLATIIRDNGDAVHLAHLSELDWTKNGQRISVGTIVGKSGGKPGTPGAGNSTGPHLHIDVLTARGVYVDPAKYLIGGAE